MTGPAPTPRRRSAGQLPPEPEAVLLRKVVQLARLRGWLVYHTWTSIHSPSGFPDLVLVRGGRLILAELKRERGNVTAKQRLWLDGLGRVACAEVFTWRPSSWTEIEWVLQ